MSSELSNLEIASGVVCGAIADFPGAAGSTDFSPIAALERAVLAGLTRSPCLISFSGGKDSSLLLALAMNVARREGLPPPIPVTWRFSDAPRADESSWQDQIIRSLGVSDWSILSADDELDFIAPIAQDMLREYGVQYPANLHLHQPIVAAAEGGSVITGLGGDQVLTCWHRLATSASFRTALRRRIPPAIREAVRPRQAVSERPWLRPRDARSVHAAWRRDLMTQPREPGARLTWRTTRRQLTLTRASCAAMAQTHDVAIHHPLLDPWFLAALSRSIPQGRSFTRSQLIAEITQGQVPRVLYERSDKAWFGEVFVRQPSREFAARWDGSGADAQDLDARRLQKVWSEWPARPGTELLLQQMWLNQDRASRRISV